MADTYYERAANRIRMEMDRRSPRLRLSIIGYLLDAGRDPEIRTVNELVDYVAEDTAAYADDVAALKDPEEEKEEKPNPDKSAYDILGEGYL